LFGEAFGCADLDWMENNVPRAVMLEWIEYWGWKNEMQGGRANAGASASQPLDLKPGEMAALFKSSGYFKEKKKRGR
jgi:hypothetical protein